MFDKAVNYNHFASYANIAVKILNNADMQRIYGYLRLKRMKTNEKSFKLPDFRI